MTSIEFLMPFLVIAITLATAAAGFFCARTEARLSARRKITLANYKQKNYLFYTTKDIPVLIVSLALLLLDVVLLIIALTHPVIRLYALALAVMIPVEGAIAWLSFSREKCGRDLHVFDAYHVRVQDLLCAKSRLEAEIGACRRRADELRNKLNATIGGFNQNLAYGIPGDFVRELFTPLDEMLSGYLSEIDTFSKEIEAAFNAALREFLLNNTEPELQIVPLRAFDEVAVDDLLASIKTSFGTNIAALVVEEAGRGAVRNAAALGNIMNLLHTLDVKVEGKVLARFIAVGANFEDRTDLAKLLYQNKQIPAALLRETLIPENFEWVFVEGMNKAYNARDLAAILADLLAADRRRMCQKLVADMDATDLPVLQQAVAAEKERAGGKENSACRLASSYCLIIGNSYAAGNSGSLFENLALMLFDRRAELGLDEAEQARIVEIYRSGDFLGTSKEIAALYQKAVANGTPMMESATRILLYYLGSPAGTSMLLRPDLLAKLLGEYRFTLSIADLSTMRNLLAALTLFSEKDKGVIASVFEELLAVPTGLELPSGNQPEDALHAGRLLLAHLTQHDRVRLRSVVYRTENERQTLDRIIRL